MKTYTYRGETVEFFNGSWWRQGTVQYATLKDVRTDIRNEHEAAVTAALLARSATTLGSARTPRKAAASRANGLKGGRPRKERKE